MKVRLTNPGTTIRAGFNSDTHEETVTFTTDHPAAQGQAVMVSTDDVVIDYHEWRRQDGQVLEATSAERQELARWVIRGERGG